MPGRSGRQLTRRCHPRYTRILLQGKEITKVGCRSCTSARLTNEETLHILRVINTAAQWVRCASIVYPDLCRHSQPCIYYALHQDVRKVPFSCVYIANIGSSTADN